MIWYELNNKGNNEVRALNENIIAKGLKNPEKRRLSKTNSRRIATAIRPIKKIPERLEVWINIPWILHNVWFSGNRRLGSKLLRVVIRSKIEKTRINWYSYIFNMSGLRMNAEIMSIFDNAPTMQNGETR